MNNHSDRSNATNSTHSNKSVFFLFISLVLLKVSFCYKRIFPVTVLT